MTVNNQRMQPRDRTLFGKTMIRMSKRRAISVILIFCVGVIFLRAKQTTDSIDIIIFEKVNPATSSESHQAPTTNSALPLSGYKNSRFAYAFLICGVWPEKPAYKGYLYNVLVATQILRDEGSTADVVLLLQMDHRAAGHAKLPDKDEQWLEEMGIRTQYIPSSKQQNFYNCMLEKFRVLTLYVDYERVIFLDGDIMPLSNMDYFFEYSVSPKEPKLMENMVVAGKDADPATGGFFMLKPQKVDFEQLLEIVHKREVEAKRNTSNHSKIPNFDEILGWGHAIVAPDKWMSKDRTGTRWDFSFAFADPGLLYHWTKYAKQSVSFIINKDIHNWENGRITDVFRKPFTQLSKPRFHIRLACQKWICDFYHFSSDEKPWLHSPPYNFEGPDNYKNAAHHWYHMLSKLNEKLHMGLNFTDWQTIPSPTLGFFPRASSLAERTQSAR